MLIVEFIFRPKDKEALEAFVKHVFPFVGDLSEEEKKLVKKFLEDPVGGIKQILRVYRVGNNGKLLKEVKEDSRYVDMPEKQKALLKMLLDYAEQKGWIEKTWDKQICFIWQRWWKVPLERDKEGNPYPRTPRTFRDLKEIKEQLEEIKQKGASQLLGVKTLRSKRILWEGDMLKINYRLASEALGREVKEYKKLSFEEAEKFVDWLLKKWEKFLEEAEKRGWIYEDTNGLSYFIWERRYMTVLKRDKRGNYYSLFDPRGDGVTEIKKALEELKQKGAESFLKIKKTTSKVIWWLGDELSIYYKLIEDPCFESAYAAVKGIYEDMLWPRFFLLFFFLFLRRCTCVKVHKKERKRERGKSLAWKGH